MSLAHIAQQYLITSPALSAQPKSYPTDKVVKPWIAAEVDICKYLYILALKRWPSTYLLAILYFAAQPSLSGSIAHYSTGLFLKILITGLCSPHWWFILSIITTWICPAVEDGTGGVGCWICRCKLSYLCWCLYGNRQICFTETLCFSKLYPSCYFLFNVTLVDILVCSSHI